MGNHSLYSDEQILQDLVAEYVKNQPWYKKNANTISAAVGTAAVVASGLLSNGLELPPWAFTLATAVVGLGAIFGVKKTRNGIQPDAGTKLLNGNG